MSEHAERRKREARSTEPTPSLTLRGPQEQRVLVGEGEGDPVGPHFSWVWVPWGCALGKAWQLATRASFLCE